MPWDRQNKPTAGPSGYVRTGLPWDCGVCHTRCVIKDDWLVCPRCDMEEAEPCDCGQPAARFSGALRVCVDCHHQAALWVGSMAKQANPNDPPPTPPMLHPDHIASWRSYVKALNGKAL